MEHLHRQCAALFDFDGVVMDTETQYTWFWEEIGKKYDMGIPDFGRVIKGQTLTQIYEKYFADRKEDIPAITDELNRFEKQMQYEYVPGVVEFIHDLRRNEVVTAIVTSSNAAKMEKVFAVHPELHTLTDRILTAEYFTRSKPAPDCFLLGAEQLQVHPDRCVVFEDSFHGLQAGNAAGMTVVGLATTNPEAAIRPFCKEVIPDFRHYSFEKMAALLA